MAEENKKLELLSYQKDAVKFGLKVPFHAVFVRVGRGKSVISVFYSRLLLNKNLADKVILAGSKTSVNSFKKAFEKRAGVKVPQYDDVEDVFNFIEDDKQKICLIKHSMVQKLGFDQANIDRLEKTLTDNYKRIAVVIDECHRFANDTSNLHMAFQNIRFAFERISIQTATPIMSHLESLYGLTKLLYPKLWRSKRAFYDDHVEEKVITDYRTRRVLRKETIAYKNLDKLREKILPFSFFYYPELDLKFIEHKTRLRDYSEYDKLCQGLLTEEELEEKKNKRKA